MDKLVVTNVITGTDLNPFFSFLECIESLSVFELLQVKIKSIELN